MRVWVKLMKNTHMIKETTIVRDEEDTRTHKVLHALEEACHTLDLSTPIWLEKNIKQFQRAAKTRFTQDNFIETIEFDYLELQILEEDLYL
ncbi:MAG: hypothetical protein IKO10_00985 [Lachnospiraceae bacterium]|nr:hypothetical protein [Lachnospiraceae bacterium]